MPHRKTPHVRLRRRHGRCQRHCAGVTLIEAVVSMLTAGVLIVSVLQALAASKTGGLQLERQQRAMLLAEAMMDEILRCPLADPDGSGLLLNLLGPESGEEDGTRQLYDDVDDYHGLSESPLRTTDGTVIAGAESFRRTVSVDPMQITLLNGITIGSSSAARITVTVSERGKPLAVVDAVRTSAWRRPSD